MKPVDPKGHIWKKVVVRVFLADRKLFELYCVKCGWRAPNVRVRPVCDEEIARQVMES